MSDENKVRIIVNGSATEYEHWTDVSITSELNTLARSFQVGTTTKLPQSSKLISSFGVMRCRYISAMIWCTKTIWTTGL